MIGRLWFAAYIIGGECIMKKLIGCLLFEVAVFTSKNIVYRPKTTA